MLSLNGNPLDEEDGNLLDEVVLDKNMFLMSTEGNEEINSACAKSMVKRVCLKEYADMSKGSRVCTRKRTCQVAYGLKRSKSAKPKVTTMVLTHGIG